MSETEKTGRKISDILISLEDKISLLIKTVAANDLNNKLILDRLNKISSGSNTPLTTGARQDYKKSLPSYAQIEYGNFDVQTVTNPSLTADSNDEISVKSNGFTIESEPSIAVNKRSAANKAGTSKSESKIPVGQKVTDDKGKDIFNASVVITDIDTQESFKLKTNASGKWQTYLKSGRYNILVTKIIDPENMRKIESSQDIEVDSNSKSLQLANLIVNK